MTFKLAPDIGPNFCYAPWTNIHINTTGTYKTCCAGTEEIGDSRIVPIHQLLQHQKIQAIKQAVSNNLYHENCSICKRQEQHSPTSERAWYNDIANNQEIAIDNINNQSIQNLDIRWSNTCNLSCVYCGHEASSQWALLKQQPIERFDYTNTLPDLLAFIDNNRATIKNLALLGGEPLLQKENESLLEVIDHSVHINVITNLSVPLQKNRIFSKLMNKENVMWDVSFETIEDKFEYVRHGSNWSMMQKNLRYLQECIIGTKHNIGITSQYCIYNAMDLAELYEYFLDNNFPSFRWNELHHPDILSVAALPSKYISKAIEQLDKLTKIKITSQNKKFFYDMLNSLKLITNDKKNCDDLYEWHENQEQKYWPNTKLKFNNLWKEYKCY